MACALVFEPRREEGARHERVPAARAVPRGAGARRRRLWERLDDLERDHRLPGSEPPSAGLALADARAGRAAAASTRCSSEADMAGGRLRALDEADHRPARPALAGRRGPVGRTARQALDVDPARHRRVFIRCLARRAANTDTDALGSRSSASPARPAAPLPLWLALVVGPRPGRCSTPAFPDLGLVAARVRRRSAWCCGASGDAGAGARSWSASSFGTSFYLVHVSVDRAVPRARAVVALSTLEALFCGAGRHPDRPGLPLGAAGLADRTPGAWACSRSSSPGSGPCAKSSRALAVRRVLLGPRRASRSPTSPFAPARRVARACPGVSFVMVWLRRPGILECGSDAAGSARASGCDRPSAPWPARARSSRPPGPATDGTRATRHPVGAVQGNGAGGLFRQRAADHG